MRDRSDDPPGVALVTGAGSGMGRSVAETYLAHGWSVLAVDLTPVLATGSTGAESAGSESADRLIPVVVDVRDRSGLEAALAEQLTALGGRLDAVANVAGIYPPSTLETYTKELFHHVFEVNVLGVLNVMAAAAPYLRDGSSIVNFASVDAFAVSPGQLVYGASKAAVVMISKATALELAPRGIRVNAIAPGWVATPGTAATGRMEQAAAGIPLGRVAQPEEIADWVWLLTGGGAASFMTGDTITLSGGDVIR